jgi:hypothetical protein
MRKGTSAIRGACGFRCCTLTMQQAPNLADYSQSRGFLHASSKSASGLPAHVDHRKARQCKLLTM